MMGMRKGTGSPKAGSTRLLLASAFVSPHDVSTKRKHIARRTARSAVRVERKQQCLRTIHCCDKTDLWHCRQLRRVPRRVFKAHGQLQKRLHKLCIGEDEECEPSCVVREEEKMLTKEEVTTPACCVLGSAADAAHACRPARRASQSRRLGLLDTAAHPRCGCTVAAAAAFAAERWIAAVASLDSHLIF